MGLYEDWLAGSTARSPFAKALANTEFVFKAMEWAFPNASVAHATTAGSATTATTAGSATTATSATIATTATNADYATTAGRADLVHGASFIFTKQIIFIDNVDHTIINLDFSTTNVYKLHFSIIDITDNPYNGNDNVSIKTPTTSGYMYTGIFMRSGEDRDYYEKVTMFNNLRHDTDISFFNNGPNDQEVYGILVIFYATPAPIT